LVDALVNLPGIIGFVADEIKEMFGSIDLEDFTRREEQLVRYQDQLASQEKEAERLSGKRQKRQEANNQRLREYIALLAAELQADRDKAGFQKKAEAESSSAAVDVAASVKAVDSGPVPESEADKNARLKAELERLKEIANATDYLKESVRDFAEEQGGPAVQAANRMQETLQKLDETEATLRANNALTAEAEKQLADARDAALITYQQKIDLIDDEKRALDEMMTPAEELIASLQLELELQGLSNLERAKRIALIQAGTDATKEEIETINASLDQLAKNDEVIEAMDNFRDAASDALVSFANGSKSAKESFGDFMETVRNRLLRMIAEKLIEKAFGAYGTTGSGGSTGGIGNFISSLFGGGKAHGGRVSGGKFYEVNENGPELLNVGNKQLLMPDARGGNVVPIKQAQNKTTNITVNLPPQIRRSTAEQVAVQVSRAQSRASARNR